MDPHDPQGTLVTLDVANDPERAQRGENLNDQCVSLNLFDLDQDLVVLKHTQPA
jgi:hypothetical protein